MPTTGEKIYIGVSSAAVILMLIVVIYITQLCYNVPNVPTYAIVGSGPAGLSLALELCDKGHRDITIYGKLNNSQVRTLLVDGVNLNIGTVGVSPYAMMSKFGEVIRRFKGVNSVTAIPKSQIVFSDPTTIKSFNNYKEFPFDVIKENLHKTIPELINSSVFPADLLETSDMITYNMYGYGPPSQIPLHRSSTGIAWAAFNTPTGFYHIRGGPSKFFNVVKNYLETKGVKFKDVYVREVSHKKLHTVNGETAKYDNIIIACDPRLVTNPLSEMFDMSITHTNYFTAVLTIKGGPVPNNLNVILNDVMSKEEYNKANVFSIVHTPGKSIRHILAYGYFNDNSNDELILDNVLKQVKHYLPDNIIEKKTVIRYKYNLRYTVDAIKNRMSYMVGAAQGKNNIWYTGGLFSHWDVNSILTYNEILAHMIVMSQNNIKPPTKQIVKLPK